MRRILICAFTCALCLCNVSAGQFLWVQQSLRMGSIIELNDRSLWLIARPDRFKTTTWMVTENIEMKSTEQRLVFTMINTNQREVAIATYMATD